jgi:hypothetical protein
MMWRNDSPPVPAAGRPGHRARSITQGPRSLRVAVRSGDGSGPPPLLCNGIGAFG